MKMRRTIALCLTLAICASLAIGGTMAYLQDTDSDVNVMTLGSVYIDQKEYERVNDSALNLNDSNLKDFVFDDPSQQNPHPLFPAIGELTSKDAAWRGTEDTMPLWTNANVQDKFVTVENTGRSEAFVRTLFAVEAPANVAHPLVLNWNKNGEWEIEKAIAGVSLTKEGVAGTYDIYVANFNGVMAPKYESLPSLLQVALPCEADNKDVEAYGDRLEIYVLTQAMQVNGFDDAESAFTAGFGDVTADNVQTWFEGITPPTNTEVNDDKTLNDALAAAAAGEPAYITLTSDVTYETADHHDEDDITPASRVVIDGQGKYTITFKGSGVTPFGDTEAPITLKNLKVVDESVSYNEGAWELLYLEMGGPELICENVDFTKARISCDGQNATFVNCKFAGAPSEYAVWVSNGNAEFVNCSFTGARGLKMHEDYGSEIGHVYVEDCDFGPLSEKPGVAIGTLNADTEVVLRNNLFLGTQKGDQGLYKYESDTDVTTFNFVDENNIVVDKIHEISSKAELFAFANDVNVNNKDFAKTLVVLTEDIDLNNENWEPIGQTGATTFNGIFDGQGHSISNLNVDSMDETGDHYSSGLFGWVESHSAGHGIIKNVNIYGAEVKGHHNVGALVGYITEKHALVENCHVDSAVITCTNATSEANGDKAGAMIGNATVATTVRYCAVTNSTVNAGRDAGQLAGAAKEANVIDCFAENVTVTSNGTSTGNNIRNEVIGRLL